MAGIPLFAEGKGNEFSFGYVMVGDKDGKFTMLLCLLVEVVVVVVVVVIVERAREEKGSRRTLSELKARVNFF